MRRDENVLITGASSGIGEELARVFAKNGYNLILVARRHELLLKLKKELEEKNDVQVVIFSKDLTHKDAVKELKENLADVKVDILINNAGFGKYGEFAYSDLEREIGMIHLNIVALVEMTHSFLCDMVKDKKGVIVNIGSIASFQPGPLMANYYATKAYVLSFTEGIAREVEGSNVKVMAFCPGVTRTNFFKIAELNFTKRINDILMSEPEKVAERLYKAISSKRVVVLDGTVNRFLVFCERFMTRKFVRNIVYFLQKKRIER